MSQTRIDFEGYHTILFLFRFSISFDCCIATCEQEGLPLPRYIFLFYVGLEEGRAYKKKNQKIQWQNKQMIRWDSGGKIKLFKSQISKHKFSSRAQGIFWTNIYTAYILASTSSASELYILELNSSMKKIGLLKS